MAVLDEVIDKLEAKAKDEGVSVLDVLSRLRTEVAGILTSDPEGADRISRVQGVQENEEALAAQQREKENAEAGRGTPITIGVYPHGPSGLGQQKKETPSTVITESPGSKVEAQKAKYEETVVVEEGDEE